MLVLSRKLANSSFAPFLANSRKRVKHICDSSLKILAKIYLTIKALKTCLLWNNHLCFPQVFILTVVSQSCAFIYLTQQPIKILDSFVNKVESLKSFIFNFFILIETMTFVAVKSIKDVSFHIFEVLKWYYKLELNSPVMRETRVHILGTRESTNSNHA